MSKFFIRVLIVGVSILTFLSLGGCVEEKLLLSRESFSPDLPSTTPTITEPKESQQSKAVELKGSGKLDVPLILQMPELPRGCEVTSLAMFLNFAGVNVDKLTLAVEVKKDDTPYSVNNGRVYFGDPSIGFVGDMYDKSKPGFGVYHGPIEKLASKYLEGVVNLTGQPFEAILRPIDEGKPVWVITNTLFKYLSEDYFETWDTPNGQIQITRKEHSVVITGYDENYIYVNDPLAGQKDRPVPREDFIQAWEQMGKQAITYK